MANQFSTTDATLAAAPIQTGLHQLCFTAERADGGVDLWSPPAIEGDWAEQCRVGRACADEAIAYIRETNNMSLMPGIVRTIMGRATFGGVEAGFFTAVSAAL